METEEQIELSFTRKWDPSVQGEQSPLTIDIRFRVFFNLFSYTCIYLMLQVEFIVVISLAALRYGNFRFILFRDSPGFYSYAIYEHKEDMPAFNLNETRIAFMLSIKKYYFSLCIKTSFSTKNWNF